MCKQKPPRCEPLPEPTATEMICQFNKLKPTKFSGGPGPSQTRNGLEGWKTYLRLWNALRGLRYVYRPINLKRRLNFSGGQLKLGHMNRY